MPSQKQKFKELSDMIIISFWEQLNMAKLVTNYGDKWEV